MSRRAAAAVRGLALVLLLLAAAGCVEPGGGDAPTPAPTPSVPPPTAPTEPTPAPPEPSPTPPTEAEPLPPLVVADQTFDFSREGDPTGQSPRVRPTDRVPAGYATLLVDLRTERTSAGPAQLPVSGAVAEPSIRLLDPSGREVYAETEENVQRDLSFPALEGEWELAYHGAGTMRASVRITAVP